jgi:hypothetical protein
MNEQERAEEHLKTIRRLMERASIYRAISAPTALVGGMLSLAVTCVYIIWLRSHNAESDDAHVLLNPGSDIFVPLWLLVLLVTMAANTFFIVKGAKSRGEPVLSASMKAALFALAPGFVAGAAMTTLFLLPNLESWSNFVLALVWSGFYGMALLATGSFAPRSLILMGWSFFLAALLGLLVLRFDGNLTASLSGSDSSIPAAAFMAITFGCFHLIYAICVWPRPGATSEV